jgi:hypothetical protein
MDVAKIPYVEKAAVRDREVIWSEKVRLVSKMKLRFCTQGEGRMTVGVGEREGCTILLNKVRKCSE